MVSQWSYLTTSIRLYIINNTFFCEISAHAGILANTGDQDENFRPLFDFDTDTCLSVLNTLFKMKRNRLDLIIPQKIEDGLVRLYFSQKVVCEAEKVLTAR